MKWILLLCLCLSCSAQEALVNAVIAQQHVAAAGQSFLLSENFEGANTDSGGNLGYDLTSWTATDIATYRTNAPTGMEGTYSQTLHTSAANDSYIDHTFTAQGEVWFAFQFYMLNTDTTGQEFARVCDSGGSILGSFSVFMDGTDFRPWPKCGSVNGSEINPVTPALDTLYYVLIHYKKVTVANDAVLDIEFSSSSTFTGSGDTGRYSQITTGTSTADAAMIRFYTYKWGIIIDKVRVSATAITSL